MQLHLTVNVEKAKRALLAKNRRAVLALRDGLAAGGLEFVGKLINDQMSGRKSQNYGLNVRTGNLRRSWYSRVKRIGADLVLTVATSAKYAKVHEMGMRIRPKRGKYLYFRRGKKGKGKLIRKREVTIPKRLYARAYFKKYGIQILTRRAQASLSRFLK